MSRREQLLLTARLSMPSILAQISTIIMMYIDAAMVGSLGANEAASIGLVTTSMWLVGGICSSIATGFSVQVAHLIGANRSNEARKVMRQSFAVALSLSIAIAVAGSIISPHLPHWLGGNDQITSDASSYFLIMVVCVPFLETQIIAGSMLRSSGNMRIPSLLNVLMCVLDVLFNFFFIFHTREVTTALGSITIPGMGLGVTGAAMGSALAEVVVAILMMYYVTVKSSELAIINENGSFKPTPEVIKRAVKIGTPIGIQQIIMSSAQILITAIVAPLGSVAIAANAFGITAESLCYMPGFGIADAATTLVGQSVGAKRRELTRSFAQITVTLGIVVMTVMGIFMYVGAPIMMGIMTPVQEVVDLGVSVMRIEAFAEPLFAAAIVSYGVMVGAGDTLMPCVITLSSMWAVRLTLAALLAPRYGLKGVWTAMCIELCFRGTMFLIRLARGKWMNKIEKN